LAYKECLDLGTRKESAAYSRYRPLSEQVAVDVLGGLDLAVPHLVGELDVGREEGDQQRGAHVPGDSGATWRSRGILRGRSVIFSHSHSSASVSWHELAALFLRLALDSVPTSIHGVGLPV
jgi:hypothetical protein